MLRRRSPKAFLGSICCCSGACLHGLVGISEVARAPLARRSVATLGRCYRAALRRRARAPCSGALCSVDVFVEGARRDVGAARQVVEPKLECSGCGVGCGDGALCSASRPSARRGARGRALGGSGSVDLGETWTPPPSRRSRLGRAQVPGRPQIGPRSGRSWTPERVAQSLTRRRLVSSRCAKEPGLERAQSCRLEWSALQKRGVMRGVSPGALAQRSARARRVKQPSFPSRKRKREPSPPLSRTRSLRPVLAIRGERLRLSRIVVDPGFLGCR